MNVLDVILILPLLYGLVRGLMRGAVMEITSLVGVVLSFVVARIYTPDLAPWTADFCSVSPMMAKVIAFMAIFLIALLAFRVMALLLERFLKLVFLGWLNRLLGGVLGLLKLVLIESVFLNLLSHALPYLPIVSEETIAESVLYAPILSCLSSFLLLFSETV